MYEIGKSFLKNGGSWRGGVGHVAVGGLCRGRGGWVM